MPDHYNKFMGLIVSLVGFAAVLHITYILLGVYMKTNDSSVFTVSLLYLFILALVGLVLTMLLKIIKSVMVSREGLEIKCYPEDDTQEVITVENE